MPQIELNSACNQSLYKQLSQNVSDSDDDDSEDEVVRFQSQPRTAANPMGVSATALYSPAGPKLDNHPILVTPRTEQMYLNHAATGGGFAVGSGPNTRNILLDMGSGSGGGMCPSSEAVAIFGDGGVNSTNSQDDESAGHIMGVRKPMGPCRKFCFCLSIFVCFASVGIFLWGLPCHNELTCPARAERSNGGGGGPGDLETQRHNWIRDFEKVEFKSVISVTRNGAKGYGKNVIFMYRGDRIFEKPAELQHPHHNGILALMGTGGQISWYDQMVDEPSSIDCGILDVDKNGTPDCLVIDEYGQLGCINPMSGVWMWHISLYQNGENSTERNERRKAIDLLDFPLILPDIDGDSVNDLLLVTSLEQAHHNNFLFVSGAHGRPLSKAHKLSYCEFIHKLKIEEEKLCFNCINNDTEVTRVISLHELFKLSTGKELRLPKDRLLTSRIEQHKFYGQRKNTANQKNIYSNGVSELVVENSGKCPLNCTMSITVSDEKGNSVIIIQGSAMYGMVPAALIPRARQDLKEQHSGFVIKFWEWMDEERDKEQEDRIEPEPQRVKRDASPQNINWTFVKKERWTGPAGKRQKRQAAATDLPLNVEPMNDLVKRRLKEHVVLIMFNGTSQKVINTSQSDVVQFCRMNSFCQPDMNYQENSVTIADLDEDGYNQDQELISFYSTFVEQPNKTWKLVTYVQSFRLEKELVSFYDT